MFITTSSTPEIPYEDILEYESLVELGESLRAAGEGESK